MTIYRRGADWGGAALITQTGGFDSRPCNQSDSSRGRPSGGRSTYEASGVESLRRLRLFV